MPLGMASQPRRDHAWPAAGLSWSALCAAGKAELREACTTLSLPGMTATGLVDLLDKNNDGRISCDELAAAMASSTVARPEAWQDAFGRSVQTRPPAGHDTHTSTSGSFNTVLAEATEAAGGKRKQHHHRHRRADRPDPPSRDYPHATSRASAAGPQLAARMESRRLTTSAPPATVGARPPKTACCSFDKVKRATSD